jgi:hypothetical protein
MQNQIFDVELDIEIHCDMCLEPIHFHFEGGCPICGAKHAGTYTDYGISGPELNMIFYCENCDSKFKILELDIDEAKIICLDKK